SKGWLNRPISARLIIKSCSTCLVSAQGANALQAMMFIIGIIRRAPACGGSKHATAHRAPEPQAQIHDAATVKGRARPKADANDLLSIRAIFRYALRNRTDARDNRPAALWSGRMLGIAPPWPRD